MIDNLFKITALIVVTGFTNILIDQSRTNCHNQTVNRNSIHTKTITDFDFAYIINSTL